MALYPCRDDEEARIETLRGLGFERFEDQAFVDRLADIGQGRFDALVFASIVDEDVQRILGSVGEEIDDIPREQSICTYTIMEDEVLVIRDVLQDDRFAENTALHEAGLNFYAGAPIVVEGMPIGTVCMMAEQNRELTEADRRHLRGLADELAEQLELRNQLYDHTEESLSDEISRKIGDDA